MLLPRAMEARAELRQTAPRRELPRMQRNFRERLARELDLTPEQRTRIDSLLDAQAAELRAIRGQTHPRIESTIARTRREIDAVLTPEQRTRAAELGERRRGPR